MSQAELRGFKSAATSRSLGNRGYADVCLMLHSCVNWTNLQLYLLLVLKMSTLSLDYFYEVKPYVKNKGKFQCIVVSSISDCLDKLQQSLKHTPILIPQPYARYVPFTINNYPILDFFLKYFMLSYFYTYVFTFIYAIV